MGTADVAVGPALGRRGWGGDAIHKGFRSISLCLSNATMLLPLHSMMVVGWVAVPRPDTHRTLISVGAVGSWSVGWGSLAWEWEVSGLLFCCLLLLLLNTPVGFELCACTYSASSKRLQCYHRR